MATCVRALCAGKGVTFNPAIHQTERTFAEIFIRRRIDAELSLNNMTTHTHTHSLHKVCSIYAHARVKLWRFSMQYFNTKAMLFTNYHEEMLRYTWLQTEWGGATCGGATCVGKANPTTIVKVF